MEELLPMPSSRDAETRHPLKDLNILIKGAGDLATGVAVRLFNSGFRRILMLETKTPMAVRRTVSFSEAVYTGEKTVEGIPAVCIKKYQQVMDAWKTPSIPILVDHRAQILDRLNFDVLVDAIVAKKNLGTAITDADLVIGLGPGFTAGQDVHCVIETRRGHTLGRVLRSGSAVPNTGIPGKIEGVDVQRVLRSPAQGLFETKRKIGGMVHQNDIVGEVNNQAVCAGISGVLRGLLRTGTRVRQGTKLGDIDPRTDLSPEDLNLVSDKARALGGAVLEAVLETFLIKVDCARNPN